MQSRSLTPFLAALVCLAVVGTPAPARAQSFEIVGVRALGMGGAFVAVADDTSAIYWNPAGLSNAALVDIALQRTGTSIPLRQDSTSVGEGGWRGSATFVGFAMPSLGVSYLRTRVEQAFGPTAGPTDSRQQDRPGVAEVSSRAVDEVGLTLLQSLLANVVVGGTVKLARGSSATQIPASGASMSAAFEAIENAPRTAATRFNLDVGVLAFSGPLRVGFVGRNLPEPDFGGGGGDQPATLERQFRAGIAITPGFVINRTVAAQPSLTIALDADLTRTTMPTGDERHVAAGVERWFMGRRLAVRGGVRANTIGSSRVLATAGASVGVRAGLLAEGQFARGGASAGQQWSIGGRVTF